MRLETTGLRYSVQMADQAGLELWPKEATGPKLACDHFVPARDVCHTPRSGAPSLLPASNQAGSQEPPSSLYRLYRCTSDHRDGLDNDHYGLPRSRGRQKAETDHGTGQG
jgi:hypothetical protein